MKVRFKASRSNLQTTLSAKKPFNLHEMSGIGQFAVECYSISA
jgi:hypothetical protein